jgi:hypothetical protein
MRSSSQPSRSGRARLGALLAVAVVALLATACSTSPSTGGSGAPSTIAPGSPWQGTLVTVTLPPPVNSLDALDCVDSARCWAVGSTVGAAGAPNGAAIVATTNGGGSWSLQPVPATVAYLSGISCSDRRHCTAVGQAGQTANGPGAIITTADGGATWQAAAVPTGVLDVTAVACQADRRCMATGSTASGTAALVSASAQAGWVQRGALPPTLSGATGISCPDSQQCWVTAHSSIDVDHVAGAVAVTTNGGSTWAATAPPAGVGYLNGIVCTPHHGGGLPFTSTTVPSSATPPGATPGSTTTSPPTTSAPAVSTTVPPAGVAGAWCVAVGTTANTLTGVRAGRGVILTSANGGATWSSQPVTPSAAALMGVSCTAVDSCVAVGSTVALSSHAGVAVLTASAGHPWRSAAAAASPQELTAVSCISLSGCVLVGESISEHLAGS